MSGPGRPCAPTPEAEAVIKIAVLYYADNNTTLQKEGLLELVQHYFQLLPLGSQQRTGFKDNCPSLQWLNSFLGRHSLSYRSRRIIGDKLIQAFTQENLAEYISRVNEAIKRYNIRDGSRILNMDQSGMLFEKMLERSLRKGIGSKSASFLHKADRTKGSLDMLSVVPVVSVSGHSSTPVIVFPGIQPHFRKLNGVIQTVHDFLPTCYFYQREVPGVDIAVIYDWAQKLFVEIRNIREKTQYVLLLIDEYEYHVQFSTLQLFRGNRIIVIAMPSHSSHRLQPLDVSLFSSYKSFTQRELQKFARRKTSGFRRCGVRDADICNATNDPLLRLIESHDKENSDPNITVHSLLRSFERQERILLRDADDEESGTIKIQTQKGCHLTSGAVIEALKHRELNKKKKAKQAEMMQILRDHKEPAKDIEHLIELAPKIVNRPRELVESRDERRFQRRHLAVRKNMILYQNSQGAICSLEDTTN